MKITRVDLRDKEKEGSRMKAIAKVTIDEAFVITGIRLIQGDDKMFIAMPSRPVSEGTYDDVCHPVNQETRKMFEDAIFKAYEEMKKTGEEKVIIDL
jgi:stage V sporulation protein G